MFSAYFFVYLGILTLPFPKENHSQVEYLTFCLKNIILIFVPLLGINNVCPKTKPGIASYS